jgi:hypothetical protein
VNILNTYSNIEDVPFFNVNVTKRGSEAKVMKADYFQLDELYPAGRPIEKLKYYNDL